VDEGGELKGFSRLAFISLRMRERYLVTASDSMAKPCHAPHAMLELQRVDGGYLGVFNGGKRMQARASRIWSWIVYRCKSRCAKRSDAAEAGAAVLAGDASSSDVEAAARRDAAAVVVEVEVWSCGR
jgi:hypothetical protein